jgi:hypothetical protein
MPNAPRPGQLWVLQLPRVLRRLRRLLLLLLLLRRRRRRRRRLLHRQ